MDKKGHSLTNEQLAKKFKSNFELVSYAIRLAENMIKTGRDARVKSEVQNRAMLILEEINAGKDQFDQIPEPTSSKNIDGIEMDGDHFKTQLIMEEKAERRRGYASFADSEE